MKSPKNRTKAFRVNCPNCHATQDSLLFACVQCGKRLYSNMESDEMQAISQKVAAMEAILGEIDEPAPQKGNPYQPLDKAWDAYKALRGFTYIPGMTLYLDRVMEVLLPIKLKLLQRTVKANWIFLAILAAFPLTTLAFGMQMMIFGLLSLPVVAWLVVTLKASNNLRRTKAKLAQIRTA